MRIHPEIYDDADEVGRAAALQIAAGIEAASFEGRRFVLGCPSGRSPLSTYRHLAEFVAARRLGLEHVVIALMDEYVVRDGDRFRLIDSTLPHSCIGFGRREIFDRLNVAAPPEGRIPNANLWHPSPETADGDYDRALEEIGGIDVFLVASGASDGHIALNQAGSDPETVTRVVELGERTRRDNLATFPTLRSLEAAPSFGVTVGIGTIRDLSRSVIMVVTGEHKQVTVARLAAADTYQPDWPATILTQCASPRFLVDRSAAALLEAPYSTEAASAP